MDEYVYRHAGARGKHTGSNTEWHEAAAIQIEIETETEKSAKKMSIVEYEND